MKIKSFFQLIRWKNLVLIALMQFLVKYYLISNNIFLTQLNYLWFTLLITATILITAGGYIINDIIDFKIDIINKPTKTLLNKKITIKSAKRLYYILNFIGIFGGFLLSLHIEKPLYTFIFISISALLYIYSKYLKGILLIGNIIISTLLGFSILIVLIFDESFPRNLIEINSSILIQHIIILYAIGAFLINLIREIVKDLEDINGDYNNNLKTLPILFGRTIARNIAISISIINIFFILFIVFNNLSIISLAFGYIFLLVFIPLLYSIYMLYNARTKNNYKKISSLLKFIIFTGILSIPMISNYFLYAR